MKKNTELRKSYRSKPCVVCGKLPSDPCHIKSYATTLSDNPNNLVPLCRPHHAESHSSGIWSFAKKYPAYHAYIRGLGWEFIEQADGSRKLTRQKFH